MYTRICYTMICVWVIYNMHVLYYDMCISIIVTIIIIIIISLSLSIYIYIYILYMYIYIYIYTFICSHLYGYCY